MHTIQLCCFYFEGDVQICNLILSRIEFSLLAWPFTTVPDSHVTPLEKIITHLCSILLTINKPTSCLVGFSFISLAIILVTYPFFCFSLCQFFGQLYCTIEQLDKYYLLNSNISGQGPGSLGIKSLHFTCFPNLRHFHYFYPLSLSHGPIHSAVDRPL